MDINCKINQYLDDYAKLWPFSGVISVVKEGEVIFSKGYGMANIEHSVPNTTKLKYKIASLTKQFTCAGIMILQERGLLKDLEQSIFKFVCQQAYGILVEIFEKLDDKLIKDRNKKIYRNKGFKRTSIKIVMGEIEYNRRIYEYKNKDDKNKMKKLEELYNYLVNNKEGIVLYKLYPDINFLEPPEGVKYRNLGTVEHNICDILSQRMKGNKTSWSKKEQVI
ncbi:UPF0236 family protein [Clostridium sp. D2Q-14]|uniref:UPF0236 family transposase-like protein n=1 Tax=Anaeromonas gelatinilytica TaxID=2683194 RepID=UPI00193C56B4|nr:serine hydrolase domain-containing protein [Anaeromonas gelatinilytica]MBS4534769.1 UPF0236 family protein [Anaeromonas gelatinilytica]